MFNHCRVAECILKESKAYDICPAEEMYLEMSECGLLPSHYTIMNSLDAASTKPSQAVSYSMEYN